ncbi:MAG: AAA family ATPase [Phycisphaerales bacterium]
MTPTQEHLRQDRTALEAELKSAGAEIRGTAVKCPFHADDHASGSIYQTDGVWRFKCQVPTCGVGGDLYDIRARVSGRPLAEVLKEADPDARPAQAPSAKSPKIHKTLGDLRQAVAWVAAQASREIEVEHPYTDPDSGRVDLLVFRLSKLTDRTDKKFLQAHPVPGGWSMTAPENPPLYNRVGIRTSSDILFIEGEKAADAINAVGLVATTTPMGAGKAHLADLSPLGGKNVYIWPDPDAAGITHGRQSVTLLSRLAPPAKVFWIDPASLDLSGKEDAFDYIAQCRVAAIDPKQAILDAMSRAKRIDALSDYRDRQAAIIRGELRRVPLPWRELDRLTWALLPGRVTILAGSKGAAKSFLLLACVRSWLDAGERVAMMLMEGSREEYLDRALAQLSGVADVTDPEWQREHPDEVRTATDQYAEELARLNASITRSPMGATINDVATWLETEAPRRRILCVDPVTMAATVSNPWDDAKMLMDRAKRAAESHGGSIVLVSHLAKGAQAGDVDRLAGGAAYERFSDCIIQLHRHDAKTSIVRTDLGKLEVEHNQTIFIEKARAPGTGYRLAYTFAAGDSGPLAFTELGIIVKSKKA